MAQNSDLNPLQQTIFEQAPQAGFTPPEVQNVYQEGKTIFGQQPVTIDNSATMWYELGQNAFNIANKTFGDVIDYMIDTKANSVRDIKDMYQAKIFAEYDNLQQAQADAKSSGDMKTYSQRVDALVTNVRNYRKEWKDKVNEALENGKGSLFTPAIDYWDENLDMKTLGLRYQELAVLARSSDRDLENAIRKTEWDAVMASIGQQKEVEDREARKAGQLPFDANSTYDLISAGRLPIPMTAGGRTVLMPNGEHFGMTVDVATGQATVKLDNRGQPVLIQDDNGAFTMNPAAGLDWITDPAEAATLVSLSQNYPTDDNQLRGQSAMFSVNGTIAPDTMKRIEFEMAKDNPSPGALMMAGAVFAAIPPGAVATNLAKSSLSEDQKSRIILASELTKGGAGAQGIIAIRGMQPKAATTVVNYINSMTNANMLMSGMAGSDVFGAANDARIMNTFLPAVITTALGLSDDEMEELKDKIAVEAGGSDRARFIRDADTADGQTLASFLEANPDAKAATMHAMAYLMSNASSIMGDNGEIDEEKLAALAKDFTRNHMAVKGLSTFTDGSGRVFTVRNEGYLWTQQFFEAGKDKREETNTAFMNGLAQHNDIVSNVRNVTSGAKKPVEYITESAKAMMPKLDTQLFLAAMNELRSVQSNRDGVNTGDLVGPDVWLPLAVASNPDIQRLYGPVLGPDATMADRIERMKIVLEDIGPVSEWGLSTNSDPSFSAYSRASQGGIPISIKRIPSKKNPNVNLLEETIPRNMIDPVYGYTPSMSTDNSGRGIPVLSVPSYDPRSPKAEALADSIVNSRVAAQNGRTSKRLAYADSAPNKAALGIDQVISNATFAEGARVASQLRFAETQPITDATSALNDLRLNGEVLIRVAQDSPDLKETLPILKAEFGTGGQKRLFNEENMTKIVKEAKAKGAQNMADIYAYVLGVAKARNLNIPAKEVGFKASAAKRAMEATGVPIHSEDFVIPSGPRAGMVLYTPDRPDYYERLKTAAKSGYAIYKDASEDSIYISNTDIPTTVNGLEPMPMLVAPKGAKETDESFDKRFNDAFALEQQRQAAKPMLREALKGFIDQPYLNISEKRQDMTVLPSKQVAQFNSDYAAFRENLGLDRKDVNPALAITAVEYDWKGYWSEYQSFPADLTKLPEKYRLPSKPSVVGSTEAVKQIREVYEVPINQQDMNKALETFASTSTVSEYNIVPTKDMDITTLQRVEKFKEMGWVPAAFEHQVRTLAKQKNTTDLKKVIKDFVKPDQFVMDTELSNQIRKDYTEIVKDLGNPTGQELMSVITHLGDPRHGVKDITAGLTQATASNLKRVLDEKLKKLLEDQKFNIQFKQQYLLEWLSPSGRTTNSTSADRRKALLLQALKE